MIVRILGEGQVEVADGHLEELNTLDGAVEKAVEAGDHTSFQGALDALLGKVREVGVEVDADFLHDSDLILPPSDASLEEVRELLGDEGLIPG